MKEQKETKCELVDMTQDVVRGLLSLNEQDHGVMVVEQCKTIAGTIGTMLAPQLYGARIHGTGNATSIVIRSCAEALFWLNFADKKPKDVIESVEALRDFLSSPTLS